MDTPPLVTVCIDDTDRPGDRDTSRLALGILAVLAPRYRCHSLTTHPHLPGWGSVDGAGGNRSAAMRFVDGPGLELEELVHEIRCLVLEDLLPGSHPGICAGRSFSMAARLLAAESRERIISPDEARAAAEASGLLLEGLAGTGRGVVGALAGAAMAAAGGPGTYLQLGDTPLDHSGLMPPRKLRALGIERFVDVGSGADVAMRPLEVDRGLRPVMLGGQPVVLVQLSESGRVAYAQRPR